MSYGIAKYKYFIIMNTQTIKNTLTILVLFTVVLLITIYSPIK